MSELGDLLRSAREKKGATLAEVSEATRIKPGFLEALEDGEYKLLPGPVYITGFLRNYARYLRLDPDDIVQEYYATRPTPEPTVRAATRVLANGHERYFRTRVFWALGIVLLMMAGAYAIYQYSDAAAHPYSAPLLTPANLGAAASPPVQHHVAARPIYVHLSAIAPVWVRVTVDGHRTFQGILRPSTHHAGWVGHHSLYIITYNGTRLTARYDGRPLGRLSAKPGLVVDAATPTGWKTVS